LSRKYFGAIDNSTSVIAIILIIIVAGFLVPVIDYSQLTYSPNIQSFENQGNQNSKTNESSSNITNFVIINFDDGNINQYRYAKPILDRYGLKATFFEVCGWIRSQEAWQIIAALQHDGMDIEAHSMTHPNLNKLSSTEQSNFEIGQPKQCFLSHGINTTIFAYPYGEGSKNATVVDIVAKHYNLARAATYSDSGTSTFEVRYSINSWVPLHIEGNYDYNTSSCTGICHSYNNSQMLDRFIEHVNSQDNYVEHGKVKSIPIVVYHSIVTYPDVSYSKITVDTTVNLFEAEMKYLHDNGFKVLTMADLGYDESSDSLYIKGSR
jgi:peptidoglycan/xylan/chitin deacetylase (PgdA/CDA1 family)